MTATVRNGTDVQFYSNEALAEMTLAAARDALGPHYKRLAHFFEQQAEAIRTYGPRITFFMYDGAHADPATGKARGVNLSTLDDVCWNDIPIARITKKIAEQVILGGQQHATEWLRDQARTAQKDDEMLGTISYVNPRVLDLGPNQSVYPAPKNVTRDSVDYRVGNLMNDLLN